MILELRYIQHGYGAIINSCFEDIEVDIYLGFIKSLSLLSKNLFKIL